MTIRQGFVVEGGVDVDDAFGFAVEHGFEYVELSMEGQFARSRVDADEVRETADAHDLALVVHLPFSLDPGSPHGHVRDGACRELEASIDAAVAFGAEKGVFHATSRANPERWDVDDVRASIYDSVRRVDDYARERGFETCVENLKTPFFDAGDFPDLFERTDAVACLDTGHAHVTGQSLAEQADLMRAHGDRISHVHLNETRREEIDEHLPVGLGKLDFDALATAMRETDWSGTCTHEIFSFGHDYAVYGKSAFDRLLASAD